MVGEERAAVVLLLELVLLHRRAHGAVDHNDSLVHDLAQRVERFVLRQRLDERLVRGWRRKRVGSRGGDQVHPVYASLRAGLCCLLRTLSFLCLYLLLQSYLRQSKVSIGDDTRKCQQ